MGLQALVVDLRNRMSRLWAVQWLMGWLHTCWIHMHAWVQSQHAPSERTPPEHRPTDERMPERTPPEGTSSEPAPSDVEWTQLPTDLPERAPSTIPPPDSPTHIPSKTTPKTAPPKSKRAPQSEPPQNRSLAVISKAGYCVRGLCEQSHVTAWQLRCVLECVLERVQLFRSPNVEYEGPGHVDALLLTSL